MRALGWNIFLLFPSSPYTLPYPPPNPRRCSPPLRPPLITYITHRRTPIAGELLRATQQAWQLLKNHRPLGLCCSSMGRGADGGQVAARMPSVGRRVFHMNVTKCTGTLMANSIKPGLTKSVAGRVQHMGGRRGGSCVLHEWSWAWRAGEMVICNCRYGNWGTRKRKTDIDSHFPLCR